MDTESLRVPAFCPVCERLMVGLKSISTWYNHRCCIDCFIEWVEEREERWSTGWRPSPEQVAALQERLRYPYRDT